MSNYKPNVTAIGGGTRVFFTDDDLKGRPMTIADTTDVVGIPPEIQLDVPENETPAETVARMERMAGFLPVPLDPEGE